MAKQLYRPKEAQRRLGVGKTKFWEDFVGRGRLKLVQREGRRPIERRADLPRVSLAGNRETPTLHLCTTANVALAICCLAAKPASRPSIASPQVRPLITSASWTACASGFSERCGSAWHNQTLQLETAGAT
jgi:hypothetical protein